MERLTQTVHKLIGETLKPDDTAIDATMGNGFDTVFLATLCKNVFAFDVQQQAIDTTRKRLGKLIDNVRLILAGHENVDKFVNTKIKAAIFNLGYLPHSDKSIITLPHTTILALEKLIQKLDKNGRICITIYRGHIGGQEEFELVSNWISCLNLDEWNVLKYSHEEKNTNSPVLFCLEKRDF